MRSSIFRALLPALALMTLGATQGCSTSTSDDGVESLDSNLDFYSESAREYFVSVFNRKADVPAELRARIGEKIVFFDADRVSRGREAWIERWTREVRG